jgi:hypothetical protein
VAADEVGTNDSSRTAAATSVPTDEGQRGRHHSSNEDKANVFTEYFFPPLVRVDPADIKRYRYPPELSMG